jgi:hypothetical protein
MRRIGIGEAVTYDFRSAMDSIAESTAPGPSANFSTPHHSESRGRMQNFVDRPTRTTLEGNRSDASARNLLNRRFTRGSLLKSASLKGSAADHNSVTDHITAKRLPRLAVALACLATFVATARAGQAPDPNYPSAVPSYTQYGTLYYGTIDPAPIGYYRYAAYYGPASVSTPYALGYYPYPQPVVAYAVPAPYAVGYYGYGAWPYFGYPAWGWGTVYPYRFGF